MKAKKLLSVILTMAMVFTLCPAFTLTASADVGIEAGAPTSVVDPGDTVYFGKYPQSKYMPQDSTGANAEGTVYIDTNGTEFVYVARLASYYKIEPIAWRVLSNSGGELFLISVDTIDGAIPYNTVSASVTWETSTVRSWLNGYGAALNAQSIDYSSDNFLDAAFSAEEQEAILTTSVTNDTDNNPGNGENGATTNDNIFLLSIDEVNTLFRDDLDRIAYASEYTFAQHGFPGVEFWWLRSPGDDDNNAAVVFNTGIVNAAGNTVELDNIAIRPALKLDLASVIFTSDASGASAKSSATVGSGLVPTKPVAQNLKFTVLDSGMATPTLTFVQTTDNTSELRFGYSGAEAGINQYVSCVLTDDNNNDKLEYYGKLADCAIDGSGTLAIPLSGVTAGTYTLKIFSEQANGDNYTDFAGALVDISLTVTGNNGSVTHSPNDTAAPTVSSVAPNGTNEPISGSIVIEFNEAMNTAAGVGTVSLGAGTVNNASKTWSVDRKTCTIGYSGLAYRTPYRIAISGFTDVAGNVMLADSNNSFTTAAQPSTGGGSSATSASLGASKGGFDKNPESADHKDISITLNKGSYTLSKITCDGKTLTEGTDYTVSGAKYTFTADFLSTLDDGEHKITFDMNGGTDPVFTVTVTDTTPEPVPERPFPFTDVPKDAWYYGDVKTAYETGLINGTTATTFSPSGSLTNAEAVKLAACMYQIYATGGVMLENGEQWYQSSCVFG